MPSETLDQLVDRAAAELGVDAEFWDIWGNHHRPSPEAKRAMIAAMGLSCGTAEELENALAARAHREWKRLAPPSVVASEPGPHVLPLHIPVELLGRPAKLTIRLEDGSESVVKLNLSDLPRTSSIGLEGHMLARIEAPLPDGLPLGYHDVSVRVGSRTGKTRYIVTPEHAWTHPHLARGGRAAGIAISLYGIRSTRNWGCGDFHDLAELMRWATEELQISFIALNPLHAIHNRPPYNTSPYLPNCIFYQNFIYLDIEAIEDYAQCRRARRLRSSAAICAEIEALRTSLLVEYERVSALKLRFLKLLFAQFLREWRRDTPRAGEFRAFIEQEGDLLAQFATYCALNEHLHQRNPDMWIWPQWPKGYQRPDSTRVRAFRAKHWRRVLFYQYLQWQIDKQLRQAQQMARKRGMSIGLYHDLALATDRFGSDLWAHRPFFIPGCRVGAPPDDFSPTGQDWGFPPPNSDHHRETGYRLFVESIRKNCRHGGALRIDHVMRLFRLYWIPDGFTAAQGTYIRERSNDYLRLLALESVRNQVIVIGEDLGTVEPEVRETLARYGILSYRLFYFERDGQGEFRGYTEYPQQALVTSTTHDLPTVAGFWTCADIAARHVAGIVDDERFQAQVADREREKQKMLDLLFRMGLLASELPRSTTAYPELTTELLNAIVRFLALTPSQLLAINQEELTKEVSQQNLPGTTSQYPNWSRKMKFSLEELQFDPEAREFTALLRNAIVDSGRSNQAD